MDTENFKNLFNSRQGSDKTKILQEVLENASRFKIDGFGKGFEGIEMPTPKSQNHINSINNSEQTQQSIQNILDKLNKK